MILVVSHDSETIEACRTLAEDYELLFANTGREGIRAYEHHLLTVQMVVLDSFLDDMLAQDWLRQVSKYSSVPYVIVVASDEVPSWMIESMKAGAMDIIQKNPLHVADLAIAVHQGFDLKNLNLYLNRSKTLSKHADIQARLSSFLDFYKLRKSIGGVVAPHELAMYFPSKSLELELPLEGVIEALHGGDTLPLLKQWKEKPVLLIVEDEPCMREALTLDFSDEFEVISVANMEEAFVEIAHVSELDSAILDIGLSGLSGEKAVPVLKKMFPKIQMVMLSGYQDHPMISKALRHGAADYFLKPVNHLTLRERIYNLLESSLLNRLLGQYMGADG